MAAPEITTTSSNCFQWQHQQILWLTMTADQWPDTPTPAAAIAATCHAICQEVLSQQPGAVDYKVLVPEFRERLQALAPLAIPQSLSLPVAVLLPQLPGLVVATNSQPKQHNEACQVTMEHGLPNSQDLLQKIKATHPLAFYHWLTEALQKRQSPSSLNRAQAFALWHRIALMNELPQDASISCATATTDGAKGRQPVLSKAFASKGILEIIVKDFSADLGQLTTAVKEETNRGLRLLGSRQANSGWYLLWQQQIQDHLATTLTARRLLAPDCPLSFLAAMDSQIPGSLATELGLLDLSAAQRQRLWVKPASQNRAPAPTADQLAAADPANLAASAANNLAPYSFSKQGYQSCFNTSDQRGRAALSLAKSALDNLPSSHREFSAMTLCLDATAAQKIIDLTTAFKHRFHSLISQSQGPELWQANLQIFPLTRSPEEAKPLPAEEKNHADDGEEPGAWLHTVLREMAGFGDFNDDPQWLKGLLYPKVSVSNLKKSLAVLKNLGMIRRDPSGTRWQKTTQDLEIPHLKSQTVFGFHRAAVDLACQATKWDITHRAAMTSVAFAATPSQIAKFRAGCIKHLQEIFAVEKTVAAPNQIYQVNLQLFSWLKP